MSYMKRAGYDPAAAVELQKTFVRLSKGKRPNWLQGLFASHPPSEERVANNMKTLAELGAGGERGCGEYTQATAQLRKLQPAYKKYDDGIAALAKNDTRSAQRLGREALALAPDESKFHELLGDVALRSKDYPQSLEHYRRAIDLNPDYFKPHLAAGVAEYNLDRRADAEQALATSMKLLPTAIGAHYLARIAQDSGDLEQAVKYHQLAASSNSDVGRASARALVQLDLPRNPGRYVVVEPRLDRQGRVWVLVQNRAPVAIGGVIIAAAVANPAGGVAQGPVRVGTGRAALAPGQSMQVPTSLGPFKDPQALRLVQTQVQSAQVAR
jgi:predicted Zn-dependent protease